jgi:prepilin-type N-terminal cleavage/methylation domain-containing protein
MLKDKKRRGDDMNTHRSAAGTRSFTLIEIMITLVIMGVLATIAIPAYQNFIEDGKSQMCQRNLEALGPELKMYIVEHNVVPGDLGQLPRERIEKALARANASAGWKVKLALFLDEKLDRGYAFAADIDIVKELAKGNMRILVCPSDPRRNQVGVVSYGINEAIVGMDKDKFDKLDKDDAIIRDSESSTFSSQIPEEGAKRHKDVGGLFSGSTVKYANGFTKGGKVKTIGKSKKGNSKTSTEPDSNGGCEGKGND